MHFVSDDDMQRKNHAKYANEKSHHVMNTRAYKSFDVLIISSLIFSFAWSHANGVSYAGKRPVAFAYSQQVQRSSSAHTCGVFPNDTIWPI